MKKERIKPVMKKFLETFIISFIVMLIIEYFLPSSLNFFSFFPDILKAIPRAAYILIFCIILFWLILPERKSWGELNRQMIYAGIRKPMRIKKAYNLSSFGVNWKILYGSNNLIQINENDFYYYADEPFCPKCGYQLDSKQVPIWFGYSSKPCWYCADCEKYFKRPEKHLGEEKDIVIKRIEKEINKNKTI